MKRGGTLWILACALAACHGVVTDPDGIEPEAAEDPFHRLQDHERVAGGDDPREPADSVEPAVDWANPANPFGIGLVNTGSDVDWNRTSELAGQGGHIKLTFAGVTAGMTSAKPEWIDAIQQSYARNLVPVVRIGPNWGDMNIRALSDDAEHMHYDTLAATYASVIASLPRRENWPLVIELHNEPNLCYEWLCRANDAKAHPDVEAGWMHYSDIAAEYAAFLRDVSANIAAIDDPRIIFLNGGLAPGGARKCRCDSDEFTPGVTSIEFINAMTAAVPEVFDNIDGWATHPYPAQGAGWGFFESYQASTVGIHYYESELAAIDLDLPVYITETGWTTELGARGTREDVASWTVLAYQNDWLADPRVVAIMPFMLRDAAWDGFSWIRSDGGAHPVFDAVRNLRCTLQIPEPCTP